MVSYVIENFLNFQELTDEVVSICGISKRKRDVDNPIVRHRRVADAINLTGVSIDQTVVTMITNIDVVNITLNYGE